MKLRAIAEESALTEKVGLDTVGHVALDLAGLIPGYGEPADLANALWYAKKGEYLNAALSLISLVPELGDLLGKGTKYLGKSSGFVAKLIAKHGDTVAKYWPNIVKGIEQLKQFKPYVKPIDEIIKKILSGEYSDPEPIEDRVGPPSEDDQQVEPELAVA